ncbi:14714_t:CDS:2, partial [Funneliformis geosporum]
MEHYSKELRANFCQFLKTWLQEADRESSNELILEKCKEDLDQHHYKNLLRESNGRFGKSKKFEENFDAKKNFRIEEDSEENLLFDSGWKYENLNEEWVNEKTLVWKDNAILTKQKCGPYLIRPIKKSTYYDKWNSNGAFTIAASNTKNITKYFSLVRDSDNNISSSNIADEVSKILNNRNEKGKRAIFEYLQRLDKNGRGKMAASLEAAKIVFINAGSYKATIICKWAAYWLKIGCLPPIYQGKHQKTIRLIDDEVIANRCKTRIQLQNDGVILKAFKDFIENTLF